MRAAVVAVLVILVVVGAVLAWRSHNHAPGEEVAAAPQVDETPGSLYVAVPMGLYIPYKLDPLGEAYADRCGFSKVDNPRPSNPRRITYEQLGKNIEARRGNSL